jgi:hypothetical protein
MVSQPQTLGSPHCSQGWSCASDSTSPQFLPQPVNAPGLPRTFMLLTDHVAYGCFGDARLNSKHRVSSAIMSLVANYMQTIH